MMKQPQVINIKNCNSIGEMLDYIAELNMLYDKLVDFIDSNLDNLKTSYRYFDEHEYNRCYLKLEELKRELMHERGVAAMGGSPPSPGKIRQLRTSIARMLTIMQEEGEK